MHTGNKGEIGGGSEREGETQRKVVSKLGVNKYFCISVHFDMHKLTFVWIVKTRVPY